jgi:hypothetical protein
MNYRRDGCWYLMEFHVAMVIMNHGNWGTALCETACGTWRVKAKATDKTHTA